MFVDVQNEQPFVSVLAWGDADAVIPVQAGQPICDGVGVGGGGVLPRFHRRILLARFDRHNMEASFGKLEGFGQDVGLVDGFRIQGCCLCKLFIL